MTQVNVRVRVSLHTDQLTSDVLFALGMQQTTDIPQSSSGHQPDLYKITTNK